MYKLKSLPPTPVETLEKARAVALEDGLRYVYIGNVPGHAAEHTYCPKCGATLIERMGYRVQIQQFQGRPVHPMRSVHPRNLETTTHRLRGRRLAPHQNTSTSPLT